MRCKSAIRLRVCGISLLISRRIPSRFAYRTLPVDVRRCHSSCDRFVENRHIFVFVFMLFMNVFITTTNDGSNNLS
jgi:hypothetical protein